MISPYDGMPAHSFTPSIHILLCILFKELKKLSTSNIFLYNRNFQVELDTIQDMDEMYDEDEQ